MAKHMSAHAAALFYAMRHPPRACRVKKVMLNDSPGEIEQAGFPRPTQWQVKWQSQNYGQHTLRRGRKRGWRKTTASEDRQVLATFHKVRQPLGSGVDARDAFNALPDALRQKISLRTVRERLCN